MTLKSFWKITAAESATVIFFSSLVEPSSSAIGFLSFSLIEWFASSVTVSSTGTVVEVELSFSSSSRKLKKIVYLRVCDILPYEKFSLRRFFPPFSIIEKNNNVQT